MAKEPFITEAKARRIINAVHASGLNIASVTIKPDGVTLYTSQNTERSADSMQMHLPKDWDVCPFDAPVK